MAHLCIQKHGEQATAKAREMVEQMREKGDHEGADTWLRIIVAIGTLGTPPRRSKKRRPYPERLGSLVIGRRACGLDQGIR